MTERRDLILDVAPVVVLGLLAFLTGDTDGNARTSWCWWRSCCRCWSGGGGP